MSEETLCFSELCCSCWFAGDKKITVRNSSLTEARTMEIEGHLLWLLVDRVENLPFYQPSADHAWKANVVIVTGATPYNSDS